MHARNKGSPKAIGGYKDKLIIIFQLNLCDIRITDNRIFCELDTIGKLLTPLLSPACKRQKMRHARETEVHEGNPITPRYEHMPTMP